MNVKSGKCDLKYHLLLFIAVNAFPVNVTRFPLPLADGGFTKSTALTLPRTVLSAALPRWIQGQVDVFLSCSTPSITGDNPIRPSPTASSWQYQRHGERRRLSPPPHWAQRASDGWISSVAADGMLLFSRFLSGYMKLLLPKPSTQRLSFVSWWHRKNVFFFFSLHPPVNPILNQSALSSFLSCFFLR